MRTKILKLLRDTKEYVSGQELCEKFGVLVAMGSDSHGARQVGEFSLAEQLLREVSFPEKLVVNHSKELLADLLKRHH